MKPKVNRQPLRSGATTANCAGGPHVITLIARARPLAAPGMPSSPVLHWISSPWPHERRPRPDFALYAPLRAEQIRSNTSRASAIDSNEGCGFPPTLDPLPE
jgi:hypothetical protein